MKTVRLWSAVHLNVMKFVVTHEHSSSWKKKESNQSAFQKGGRLILRDSVCLMDSINSEWSHLDFMIFYVIWALCSLAFSLMRSHSYFLTCNKFSRSLSWL